MLKVKFMLGAAADRYEWTGKVPAAKWTNENGGSVFAKTFRRGDELEAYYGLLRETFGGNWAVRILSEEPDPARSLASPAK